MPNEESVFIQGKVVRTSPKAVRLIVEDSYIWIPFSQIVQPNTAELEEGPELIDLEISGWIAREKGLI